MFQGSLRYIDLLCIVLELVDLLSLISTKENSGRVSGAAAAREGLQVF